MIVILGLIALMVSGTIRFGSPPAKAGSAGEDPFVQVDTASWGVNCNSIYVAPTVINGKAQPPVTVHTNNVLRRVSALCNGKTGCEIPVSASTLGDDPLPNCDKHLVVEYRCFTFDKIHRLDKKDKATLEIDCNAAPPVVKAEDATAKKAE